jgi:predicted amidohydrolase
MVVTMTDLKVAAVQFQPFDGDKAANLARIEELTKAAVERGADVICFHECSLSGYSFVQKFSKQQMLDLAEPVPDGDSTRSLIGVAKKYGATILAGLFERDGDRIHNTAVCVDSTGLLARHRKLHTFVNPHLTPGDSFTVFDIRGWKCGILICYDNNLPENVRCTALLGAEIIFMPHVTGCLPSVMPGRGLVDPKLWERRQTDPVPLRLELNGPKGRGWLMRWLPARAWENGVYAVFSNPIGMEYGQVRNGNAMILDPFGEVQAECSELDDDICIATCTREKLDLSSGRRYLRARRPELYAPLTAPSDLPPLTEPGWKLEYKK